MQMIFKRSGLLRTDSHRFVIQNLHFHRYESQDRETSHEVDLHSIFSLVKSEYYVYIENDVHPLDPLVR